MLRGVIGAAVLWMGGGSACFGDMVVVDRIDQPYPGGVIYGGAGGPGFTDTTEGGEFTAVPTNTSLLNNYSPLTVVSDPNLSNQKGLETFCLELSVGFPSSLPVGPIQYQDSSTILNDPSEQVTLGTAWLYSQFASGSLTGYHYGQPGAGYDGAGFSSPRALDAAALQAAIWFLQGQYPDSVPGEAFQYAGGASNPFLDLLTTPTASGGLGLASLDAALVPDPSGFNVNVMNIGDPGVDQYQAQLIIDPTVDVSTSPLIPVPECGAALMPVGLAIFAGIRLTRKARRLREPLPSSGPNPGSEERSPTADS